MAYLDFKITILLVQKAQIALLIIKKVSILAKYIDYIDVFSKKLAMKLFKCLNISKYTINLEFDKQLLYRLIYSLKLVEFKNFKIYIKINLANNFIQL